MIEARRSSVGKSEQVDVQGRDHGAGDVGARRRSGRASTRRLVAAGGMAIGGIAAAVALGTIGACGASAKGACDPSTIEANGNCYWEKTRACDAIGCIPPNECVETGGSPSHVECHEAAQQ
jgi:hypothetical protein